MTLNGLASKIAKHEGKKVQTSIGNIREIVGIVADVFHAALIKKDVSVLNALANNGAKRAKKKEAEALRAFKRSAKEAKAKVKKVVRKKK